MDDSLACVYPDKYVLRNVVLSVDVVYVVGRHKLYSYLIGKAHQVATDEIRERAEYELGVIIRTGFAEYYLIVWDFINYARTQDIPVGPGRGSGVGSIIAYAIGITNLDPLKYQLFFERFLFMLGSLPSTLSRVTPGVLGMSLVVELTISNGTLYTLATLGTDDAHGH
mgnify:CR=1 FL=1